MQKIKITLMSKIDKPEAFKDIDISYGVSYLNGNYIVKTVDNTNSWAMKVLSKIDKFIPFFAKKGINEDKEIIGQIMQNSQFLQSHQKEQSENLHIQINSDSKLIKGVSYFSGKNKPRIEDGINPKSASFRLSDLKKRIFLGLDMFKAGSDFYEVIKDKISRKEAASFVFFHEYSHSIEMNNHTKFINTIPINNDSYDRLYTNIKLLSIPEEYKEVAEMVKSKKDWVMPSEYLLKYLYTLHKEIYADTNALLFMRNKDIIDGNFSEENFEKYIDAIVTSRQNDHIIYQRKLKNLKRYISDVADTFTYNTHFTVPGIESLSTHVKKYLQNQPNDKILTNEDMYKISDKCMQEGIAKTILLLKEAMPMIESELNTIFSIRTRNSQYFLADDIKRFDEAMVKINNIVPEQWQTRFKNNLKKLEHTNMCRIFDAAMNQENFDKNFAEHEDIKKFFELSKMQIKNLFEEKPNLNNTIEEDKLKSLNNITQANSNNIDNNLSSNILIKNKNSIKSTITKLRPNICVSTTEPKLK